jgi:hypothetical protein
VVFLLNNDKYVKDISASTVPPAASGLQMSKVMVDFQKQQKEVNTAREKLRIEQEELDNEKTIMQKYLENSDVIQFNVGGEIMLTSRASLLHVADSKLSKMLLEKSAEKLSVDKDGNTFLDFNPTLFRHLLEQLRLIETGEIATFYPPITPALALSFNSMLEKLGLKPTPISDEDIFTFNVGDEIVATQRKTLNRVPNSKLSTLLSMNNPSDMDPSGKPFLDYDPSLFRHLLSQLQGGKTTDFEAPSNETQAAYNAMLKNFALKPKSL